MRGIQQNHFFKNLAVLVTALLIIATIHGRLLKAQTSRVPEGVVYQA